MESPKGAGGKPSESETKGARAMALTYTGKLFRRIAICCGAAHGKLHEVSKSRLEFKYPDEYNWHWDVIFRRGANNKWTPTFMPADDNEYNLWKGLKWLEENGYIKCCERTVRLSRLRTGLDTYITLTEKGAAIAPKYIKQKED
jgi:hypothetical protein